MSSVMNGYFILTYGYIKSAGIGDHLSAPWFTLQVQVHIEVMRLEQ
jgi:hypothetical protein